MSKSKFERLKSGLTSNRIFFETLAAFSLSAMAIILSYYQITIGLDQTEILRIQTELNERQIKIIEQNERIAYTAKWGELRNAMWAVMDLYHPGGVKEIILLSREQKLAWNLRMRKLLDSQIINPVLIQNKMCLGYWRNAISTSKGLETLINTKIEEEFLNKQFGGILNDIMYVWENLVLDSDEVSPTGGKPEEDSLDNR